MMQVKNSAPTPERLVRTYIRAKDENRPHLMEHVFAEDACLEIIVKSGTISFPPVTRGLASITEVLVRSFAIAYENVYTFCLERPDLQTRERGFSCDWLVGMSEREGGRVRVGCGRYDWRFSPEGLCLVDRLVITIEVMQVLPPGCNKGVFEWLSGLPYPWCSAEVIAKTAPVVEGIEAVIQYLTRREKSR
jgi:hypothetical protein